MVACFVFPQRLGFSAKIGGMQPLIVDARDDCNEWLISPRLGVIVAQVASNFVFPVLVHGLVSKEFTDSFGLSFVVSPHFGGKKANLP